MSATAKTRTRRSQYAPVNAVVHCGYWRENYTVVSHNDDGSVTVRWHGRQDYPGDNNHLPDRLGTHRTPFDPRLDRIVTQPAIPGTPLTDAIDEALAALERAYPELHETHDVLVPDPDYGPAAASYCLHDITALVRALRDALRDGGAHA